MKALIALFVVTILSGCAVQPIAYQPMPVYRPAPVYAAPYYYGPSVIVDVHRHRRW